MQSPPDAFPWRQALLNAPEVRPLLEALAHKALRTGTMPVSATLGPRPAALQAERTLSFIFGGCRIRDGRIAVRLPDRLRTTDSLQALCEATGTRPPPPPAAEAATQRRTTALLRQALLHPAHRALLAELDGAGDLTWLFREREDAEAILNGLLQAVTLLLSDHPAITLSQLGGQVLRDSKALRSGSLRSLLGRMVARAADLPADDPDAVLGQHGVVDNPCTTMALIFGPLIYADETGAEWDWPARLHAAGQPAVLTWDVVRRMHDVRLAAPVDGVLTSENAAPFHRLVESRCRAVCVYTAGYPNAAVCRLLERLGAAGLNGRHWGDTDLDGLRIASTVGRLLPMQLHRQDEATLARCADRLMPLTEAQLRRAAAFLDRHPDFRFRAELAFTMANGWLEQEQAG